MRAAENEKNPREDLPRMIFTIAEWNEDPNMRAVRSILEHWDRDALAYRP